MKTVQSISMSPSLSISLSLPSWFLFFFNFSLAYESFHKVYAAIAPAYWGGMQELHMFLYTTLYSIISLKQQTVW